MHLDHLLPPQCSTSIYVISLSTSVAFYVQLGNPALHVFFLFVQANKNLDMSINASNNFNLNITWSLSSTGREHAHIFILVLKIAFV